MPSIGNATTQVGTLAPSVPSISTDESIGGILFDLSGFNNPFANHSQIYNNFGDKQVQLIHNMSEAAQLGLSDNDFLNGLVYYHLSAFYGYINADAPLYIAFVDCSSDFDYLHVMQRLSGGRMFQLGIWTAQPIWNYDNVTVGFTNLISKVNTGITELTGKIGEASQTPLSVLLSPNTFFVSGQKVLLKKIPNALVFNAPKLSILTCQDGNANVLAIQSKNPNNAPVGSLGFALAILYLAGAEENIGCVAKFNINKDDHFTTPEIPFGNTHYKLENINRTTLNVIAESGYIVPIDYESKEGEYFFNGDSTLSDGQYNCIANNRVIHKCRRAVFNAIMPYLHGNHLYEDANRGLSAIARNELESEIGAALSGKLINKDGKYQINGYRITIEDNPNILSDDKLPISYTVGPVNYNDTLTDNVIVE